MELGAAGLQQQPFRTHGRPLVFVRYAAQQAAFDFLDDTCRKDQGLGLFQGPPLSGKSAIIHHFVATRTDEAAVAVVDASGTDTTALLESVLSQFGYDIQLGSANELINMVRVFALQQTASGHPPLLIVDGMHELSRDALRVLRKLAALRVRAKSALRIVLASDRPVAPIIMAPAMEAISSRVTGDFHLGPLSISEATDYLHAKLRAGGCLEPAAVLPFEVCDELHLASGGWPGVMDRLVLLALAKASRCPIGSEHIERPIVPNGTPVLADDDQESAGSQTHGSNGAGRQPKLILTYNGRTLHEIDFDRPRMLVGRSDHNHVSVNSRYISRHHALFVRQGETTLLMDLNSTNGTYVNSQRIANHVLMHDDVITIGDHGIKFHHPSARSRVRLEGAGFDDTAIRRNLRDIRKMLAREITRTLPARSKEPMSASEAD